MVIKMPMDLGTRRNLEKLKLVIVKFQDEVVPLLKTLTRHLGADARQKTLEEKAKKRKCRERVHR